MWFRDRESNHNSKSVFLWMVLAGAVTVALSCSSDDEGGNDNATGGSAGANTSGANSGGAVNGGTSSSTPSGGRANSSTTAPTTPQAGSAGYSGTANAGAAGGGAAGAPQTASLALYVGCADTTGTILQLAVDSASGEASPVGTYVTGASNSWATLNAAKNRMYVNSRTQGQITTLSRDPSTGALAVLGTTAVPMAPSTLDGTAGAAGAAGTGNTPSGNPATQTVTLDGSERFLLAANYGANYVYSYAVSNNGTVGALVNAQQDGVSSHQTVFAPGANNQFVVVPYRGSDKIVVYRFDATSGGLTLAQTYQSDADGTAATTGPRHVVFHPTKNTLAYVINEVAGTVSVLSFDNTTGALTHLQTISSVPPEYTGQDKLASEIAIAPSGNFVYVSNRYSTAATYTGEGSLGVFAVNSSNGQLSAVEFHSSRGALPRHFELSKDGSVLAVGNQNSNNIAVFSVNTLTGKLTHKVTRDVCTTPFFVKFVN